MRKKICKAFLMLGIASVLTACGQEEARTENLAKGISVDLNGQKTAGGSEAIGEKEAETSNKETIKEDTGVFSFSYKGTVLTPGSIIDQNALPEYTSVANVPSCAFGGNDNVYQFEAFELTTYFEEEQERVYAVYFIDPELSTTEGLCLGDTVDDMKSLYGEDYQEKGNACVYTSGETMLNIILNNGVVTSIEYCLNLK